MTETNPPVITLDGPGGAGKGTISTLLAEELGWQFLDSGALYRLTALAAMNHGVELSQESAVAVIAEHLDVRFEKSEQGTRVILENDNVTEAIREERVGRNASVVAAHNRVRDALLKRQRAFATLPGLIADGRDMGTVVFPEAPLKIFLTASAEERARRRVSQLSEGGFDADYDQVFADIVERDERDRNRATAPLKPADDAIELDTTELSIPAVVEYILALASERGLIG
ncbi:(d)CMP kinase [Reinekea blandensis]|uniref:Cytidylate kinase n=1 Tax=Reinekea blandensis MED297 TaxID=314283 RepID=A4BEF1_9GAMM|nr:(d)CMP kinase [Reinekea blandensis]EAR09378.1 cytidylate kinase [Reinekea sp. MED297] [Reinekea blandensis MED297]